MKGETPVAAAGTIIVVAALLLVGVMVYAYMAYVTPHTILISNEQICSTNCVNQYNYTPKYVPFKNDSMLVCTNSTGATTLARGNHSNGYNTRDSGANYNTNDGNNLDRIHLSGSSNGQYSWVNCTYTYDWGSANQNTFQSQNIANSGAGFALTAVLVIILAAVAVITIVAILKGE